MNRCGKIIPDIIALIDEAEQKTRDIYTPVKSFEDIWEKDGKWMTGRAFLADIILFLKGKAPTAKIEGSKLIVAFPIIFVRDPGSSSFCFVSDIVPPELRPTFYAIWHETQFRYLRPILEGLHAHFWGYPANERTIAEINCMLLILEQKKEANREETMADVMASSFGLCPLALPCPLGLNLIGERTAREMMET